MFVRGRPALPTPIAGRPKLQPKRAGNSTGDLVLDDEQILDVLLEGLAQDVIAGDDVDEADIDAHPVSGALHAAVQHVSSAELLPTFCGSTALSL